MSSHQEGEYLFTYGTLCSDLQHAMHRVLARDADFVGNAEYRGRLYSVGRYPAAVPSEEPGDRVRGELYALPNPEPVLSILDRYEGCAHGDPPPHEFRREKAIVFSDAGEEIAAWIYLYTFPTDGLELIASGDYVEFLRTRKAGG